MRDPEVVLLDEPYAGLDASARVLVDDLLSDAVRHRRTVMIASHEPPPADAVDRRVYLESGRVVPAEVVPR
jgi:ABC-type multidrug transport system ATPase subunit